MNRHNIFCCPHASFKEEQPLLLKAAALYFGRLYILDPLKARQGWIGPCQHAEPLRLLEQAGILARIAMEEVQHE